MSSMPGIAVTFGTIQQAQGDVANTVGRIDLQLGDLRSFLAPMVGTWEGGAAADYQVLQKRWDTAADDLNKVLSQISRLLGMSHDSYSSTETANANAWG
jgi:6 kDa early secretory antigenic target